VFAPPRGPAVLTRSWRLERLPSEVDVSLDLTQPRAIECRLLLKLKQRLKQALSGFKIFARRLLARFQRFTTRLKGPSHALQVASLKRCRGLCGRGCKSDLDATHYELLVFFP